VTLPIFSATEDPGPDFSGLLRRLAAQVSLTRSDAELTVRHATTVVALRYGGGVVMAGDRRATEGHVIAHRAMQKVFPADRWSAVAIAGAAGPAVEMVRLFQVQLEHYEKVEGIALSLEGKANQLAQMVREHLPMAFQGLAVVPLFAGYDVRRATGRIFTYDVTGGHYEETDFQATGSGGRDARTTIKLGFRDDMQAEEAIDLAITALYEAADEDAATGGPDLVRGIYPSVASVDAEGYHEIGEQEVATRFAGLVERRRLGRTPEGGQVEDPQAGRGGAGRGAVRIPGMGDVPGTAQAPGLGHGPGVGEGRS
jgi:proteasome beta subunit